MADASGKGPEPEFDLGVPLPPARATGHAAKIRALAKAPIGASVFFVGGRASLTTAAARIGIGWCTIRKVTENGVNGIRIWKIAEPSNG